MKPGSPGMSLPREILDLSQLLAGNPWLGLSVSAEPKPKSLWFPGVTTILCSQKANRIILALSAHLVFTEDFRVRNPAPPRPSGWSKLKDVMGAKKCVHSLISLATLRQT